MDMISDTLQSKLDTLPRTPGVYFHKDQSGEVIYVGKAAVLRNRVRQYFQESRTNDAKTNALIAEIVDVDWVETESEIDALFLESEMVKRYKPRYNILLRDDKSQLYVRIDMKNEWPTVTYTRNPADDGAEYLGPFYNGYAVKKALRYLRKIFPYYDSPSREGERRSLHDHLGLTPYGMTPDEYKKNLRKLRQYISGHRTTLVREIEYEMKQAAKNRQFEEATKLRNTLHSLKELQRRIMFGDKEFLDVSKDRALVGLTDLLGLPSIPVRIEGYDISHMSGTNVVASMVVFANGVSKRDEYRKFKTSREQNNDFDNMNETIGRRFSIKNRSAWGMPDILLIDGGKGQLDAALRALEALEIEGLPCIGIAKKEEQIVVHVTRSSVCVNEQVIGQLGGRVIKSSDYIVVELPHSSDIIRLLQRIRDESHRFAVSYHTTLKRAGQTKSQLSDIPTVGPVTQKKLMRAFGSARGVRMATVDDIASVTGRRKAEMIKKYMDGDT